MLEMDIWFIIFLIIFAIIILEWKFNCPFGATMVVLCIIPPFIKRIRIYDNKWIGFDPDWKLVFLKELDDC